jgi:hypothetical protein
MKPANARESIDTARSNDPGEHRFWYRNYKVVVFTGPVSDGRWSARVEAHPSAKLQARNKLRSAVHYHASAVEAVEDASALGRWMVDAMLGHR